MNTSLARYGLLIWVGVQLLLHFSLVLLPAIEGRASGFGAYYTASWLMVRGEFTPQAYDNEWFGAKMPMVMQEPDARDIIAPNLPTVGFALLPLVNLPPATARVVYLVASWLAGWLALAIVLWQTRPHIAGIARWRWLFGGSFFSWSAPFVFNIGIGQFYGFLFLAMVVIWMLLVRGRNGGAGVLLGLAFMLKSAGSLLFLLPLLYRRWTFWIGAAGVMATMGAASFFYLQPETWLAYLQNVSATGNRPWVAVTAYQTTLGMLSHFFSLDATWNPAPIVDIPLLVRPLYLIITVLAVGVTALTLYRTKAPISLAVALLLTLSVISVPFAEEYHFVMLLLPFAVVAQRVWEKQGRQRFFLLLGLGVGCALLFLPLPYEHPRLTVGWWALFAYPRLYGAWLLWMVGIGSIKKNGDLTA